MSRREDRSLDWQTLGSRRLYDCSKFAFRIDSVGLPDGEEIEYGVVEGHDVTFVAAKTDEGNILFVEQWRQPLGRTALSLPGGIVDEGEDIALSAARELLEETGYVASDMRKLVSYHSSPGRTDEKFHLFACRAERDPRGPAPDSTEFINVSELRPEEVAARILEGDTPDSGTVLAMSILGYLDLS